MRIAVVGAGLAGALLAWRLRQASHRVRVDVFSGDLPMDADATAASGGLVRAFETDAAACRLAAESLAELHASITLRHWSDYREVGSVYLLPHGADPAGPVKTVDSLVADSVTVLGRGDLATRYPFRDLPADTIGVAERRAGYLSPARLRARVLADLVATSTVMHRLRVTGVSTTPAVRLADGTTLGYDIVVVAAGARTPRLLADSGLPHGTLRTKQIQYTVHATRLPGLGAFVDETTGLYGRPDGRDALLLGLPSDRWDVDPSAIVPDPALAAAVTACARRRLGARLTLAQAARTVASFDCYHDPPGLALRATVPSVPVFTFTGGSGGAAKSVFVTSQLAAATLVGSPTETARPSNAIAS